MSTPTLQTIADLAGISRSAASMALRNFPKISEATRLRVRQIADEVGYRPNPMISTLMSHLRRARPLAEQGTIAYITNSIKQHGWRDVRTFVRFFNGAQERAERNGFKLEEFWLKEPMMTSRRMSHILYSRGIRGAIIAPLEGKGGHLSFDLSKLATVIYGVSIKRPQLHRADANQFEAVRTAIRELKKRGYRRIGLAIFQDNDRHVNHHFSMPYLEYMYRMKKAFIPIYDPVEATPETLLAWVKEHRVDGVISVQDIFLKWLRGHYQIPEQLGYVVLDRWDTFGDVAGVDGRAELIGHAAIDVLIGQIHRNERGIPTAPRTLLIDGVWSEGGTVRKLAHQTKTQSTPEPSKETAQELESLLT